MISLKATLSYVLLLAASAKVSAFDANQCDTFVFRTQENALWHCGEQLPAETYNQWTSLYCDHSQGDANAWLFPWAALFPIDWCNFMINTVRQSNEDHYALTPEIGINETPGPNIYTFAAIVDWGCYMVENGVTTEAYLVDSRNGQHASSVNQQCTREKNYFDYWNLAASIRNLGWQNDDGSWHPGWTGDIPPVSYEPQKNQYERCHYSEDYIAPNYVPELGVQYEECQSGFVCESILMGDAFCYPDPHADHECCISWHNKCEGKGECCSGSECNEHGYCDTQLEQEKLVPPGICTGRAVKAEKSLWNRCLEYQTGGQGDCAKGYNCEGSLWYASCQVDLSVKNDYCKWNFDNSNPRPGDCCLGWRSHCHTLDPESKRCVESQCVPGREMGVDEWGTPMTDVHDRLLTEPAPLASFNEQVGLCTGAVCGVWGDPHIVTCDDLHFDCQAVGLFTLMRNHMFNIQANFVYLKAPWGYASVTNDLVIDYVKESDVNVPTIQFSFPQFDNYDQSTKIFDARQRVVGACPILFYQDGEMIDISKVSSTGYLMGDSYSDYSVKLTGYNQIDIKHMAGVDANGDKYYSNAIIWIDGSGPYTEWSCIITYFVCLPGQDKERFETLSTGLLGTPTGNTNDDWMAPDGQTLIIPDTDRTQASFDYCVDNWCVSQEDSILLYEEGTNYEDYQCSNEDFEPFDVNECIDAQAIIEACKDSSQPVACQMERCIGNPDVVDEIETITNITTLGDENDKDNLLEFPDFETDDEYGDCANLGSGLSGSTGEGAYSLDYPAINCINSGEFTFGYDNSPSVLVGGDFTCTQGAGFEGRGVFMGDMTIGVEGCERMVATGHGSLIHAFENTMCVEVGGSVSIDATFENSKYIMFKYGDANKACHFAYAGGCTLDGETCPSSETELETKNVHTNGDFVQKTDLDLSRWEDEITLLRQKTDYWKTLQPNGIADIDNFILNFAPDEDNSPVQIFEIDTIEDTIFNIVFHKGMHGKTIMIKVTGDGEFFSPRMCYHPADMLPSDQAICGRDSFPSSLTSSIVWLFTSDSHARISGDYELHGSVVKPYGDLTMSMAGQSGRVVVGGDLTIDGLFTELHNYEFHPSSKPLPLGDDIDAICEIAPPPVCDETYKVLTGDTACPSKPEGIVKLIKASADLPEGEPILYDIIIDPPADANSAHTVKFKVDNPFTNYTDIFIKHVKKVGNFGMDPVCESMPYTAGCDIEAPLIEVGCHEYEGVDPFALVNIYFASNTDSMVMDIGSGGDVSIDKCCKPPAEYATGYGVIEYTFEIQCTCPEGVAQA